MAKRASISGKHSTCPSTRKQRQIDGADDGQLINVREAFGDYENDLKMRGGDIANVARVRIHLPANILSKTVALLTSRELRRWRDGLPSKGLAPATINRSCAAFKAALNLAASLDERVINRSAWEKGLAVIPDAVTARNVIVPSRHYTNN